MRKIALVTLGCKTNQFESAYILDNLQKSSFEKVDFKDFADIYIINTCTVTQKADFQSRQLIRRALRKNFNAIIIVTGCYADIKPHEIENIEGVDYIIGNGAKNKILEVIEEATQKRGKPLLIIPDISKERKILPLRVEHFPGHTRAFLKIQDGCNQACSFCIVPKARGRSRSLREDEVILQMKCLALSGYKEIVLTGVHLGDYGKDLEPSIALLDLMRRIEDEVPVTRVRISSLDPTNFSKEVIDFLANSKCFCNHLHLSLQSGDEKILFEMRRRHNLMDVANFIYLCHDKIPDISIGMDIIAGFPGEEDLHFNNTYLFLKNLPFTYLHVFPYSNRPGTKASKMEGQVNPKVIKERCSKLRRLSNEKRYNFYRKYIGKILPTLIESDKDSSGMLKGFSRNYIPIYIKADDSIINNEIDLKIIEIKDGKVIGELV